MENEQENSPFRNNPPLKKPSGGVPLADETIHFAAEKVQAEGKDSLQRTAENIVAEAEKGTKAKAEPVNVHSKQFPISPLRTFQGDAAEAIGAQNESLLSIKMAEEARKSQGKEITISSGSDKVAAWGIKTITIVLSLVLIGGGLITIFLFRGYISSHVIHKANQYEGLMPYDSRVESVPKDKAEVERLYTFERTEKSGPAHTIRSFNITEANGSGTGEAISFQRFLHLDGAGAPEALLRALGENFMTGLYSDGTKNYPFFLLKVTSFDNAFSGMLDWEQMMPRGILPLFVNADLIDVLNNVSPNSGEAATTPPANYTGTSTDSSVPPQHITLTWSDLLINSRDTRVLRDDRNQTLLLYSFIDKSTLLITANETAFKGIVDKFTSSKLVR